MLYEAAEMTQLMGLGDYVGEVRQGPDGHLYEWVEGVDGLGGQFGFWKRLKRGFKRFGKGLARGVRGALKVARPFARFALPFTKFIPGYGPAIYAAGRAAQSAGLFGVGDIAEGPDGQLYEVVEGVDGLGMTPVLRPIQRTIRTVQSARARLRPVCQALPTLRRYSGMVPANVRPAVRFCDRMATRVCRAYGIGR